MNERADENGRNDGIAASSAGVCSTCHKEVEKRYGGEGRYLPECIDCWTSGWAEELAASRAIEELRYAD